MKNYLKRVSIGGAVPPLSDFKMPYLDGYWYQVKYDLSTTQQDGLGYYTRTRLGSMTNSEKARYSTAAAITIAVGGALIYGSRGKASIPTWLPAIP